MAEIACVPIGEQLDWLEEAARRRRGSLRRHALVCLALALAIAGGIAIIPAELGRARPIVLRVASGSMEPTLAVGQVVKLDTSAYASAPPHIGDIVAFHPPVGAIGETPVCGVERVESEVCPLPTQVESNQIFVKRVVAAPGETITIQDGSVVRDGVIGAEPFATACVSVSACDLPTPVTVPAGYWFLMGDNREHSDDSRYWGAVPGAWIIGRVSK